MNTTKLIDKNLAAAETVRKEACERFRRAARLQVPPNSFADHAFVAQYPNPGPQIKEDLRRLAEIINEYGVPATYSNGADCYAKLAVKASPSGQTIEVEAGSEVTTWRWSKKYGCYRDKSRYGFLTLGEGHNYRDPHM